jgi:hypothetical protein
MRECFHLVSLFKIRRRLTVDAMFLQQTVGPFPSPTPDAPPGEQPISRFSSVRSFGLPSTHDGKSMTATLQRKKEKDVAVQRNNVLQAKIKQFVRF